MPPVRSRSGQVRAVTGSDGDGAARAEGQITHGNAFNSPTAVREYLRLKPHALPHKVFIALFLDARNRVIQVEELFRGPLPQTSVYPREAVKRALHFNAGALILPHNHPSGMA